MITTLHIKNIGIIDDLEIDLNKGLNVLTGETGAGKTLIIDSLNIIAGGRFSKEMMRKGEDHSFVEVCIYLPNNNHQIEGNIIVSREIYSNGRNLCKINGRMVTVNELKFFMSNIIDIHGQNDNQSLLDPKTHIGYLDKYSGEKLKNLKEEYLVLYEEYNEIKVELKKNYGDDKEKQRKLDLLRYQLNEIDEASLKENEYEELELQKKAIVNQEKISDSLNEADNNISNISLDAINIAINKLEKIEDLNEEYRNILNNLKSSYYDLQEVSRDISKIKIDTYFNEEQREDIENRLDLIYSLKRKYGNTIKEILIYRDEISKEIETIENLEEYVGKLKTRLKTVEDKMYEICITLDKIRKESALNLAEKINKELKDLEMKNSKINIKVELIKEDKFNSNGLDEVEFYICTNIGDEEKPLVKIASGGEMSRVMLAIKTVISDIDEIPILIFDEIDTGISGIAANKVGEKLKRIAKCHQVLIVTHLASIAARGEYNYYIYKEVERGLTKTKVKLLSEKEVLKEIARISSGNITEVSLEHAKELRCCS